MLFLHRDGRKSRTYIILLIFQIMREKTDKTAMPSGRIDMNVPMNTARDDILKRMPADEGTWMKLKGMGSLCRRE